MGMFSWWRRKGNGAANESRPSGMYSRLEADSRFGSGYGDEPTPSQTARLASQVNASAFPSSQGMPTSAAARFNLHKNLIRMCLRDVLLKVGIPTEWISPEVLVASSRSGMAGLHLRLRIKRWDDRLPGCALAIQRQFEHRIVSLDPIAPEWLTGISWQFAMEEEPALPKLPHPSAWTRKPQSEEPAPVNAAPMFKPTPLPPRAQRNSP